jgi:glycine dehydrogenase subunit 1
MRYVPNTDDDRRAMLEVIGRASVEALFDDIPRAIRSRFKPLGVPGRSELEVVSELRELAKASCAVEWVSFLGGGIYDHYIPGIVSHVLSRAEFYTAYTPYQPEISQGTLTAMFEFQTFVCELTGMEVANASMYDGATALAEAVLMAERIHPCRRVAVARALHPHFRRVLDTYCWGAGIDLVDLPYDSASGRSGLSDLPTEVSAIVLQTPNAFGVIEALDGVKDRLGDALLIVSANPLALGLLEPPGTFGADIVVAEGQPLGLPMAFGGPLLGLFSTRKAYLRQMPGRVAGRTVDAAGNVGYTMAMQTREQHIRRERATSNICTNSALCALAATVYLASVGEDGLRYVAELNLEKAHYLADEITALGGYELAFDGPFFNEFVITSEADPERVRDGLSGAGFLVEDPMLLRSLGVENALRLAVTEKRTRAELDRLVAVLGGER